MFDFRVFIGKRYDGLAQTADQLLRGMESIGIKQALVCPLKSNANDLRQDNQQLASQICQHEGVLSGAGRIDPWSETVRDDIRFVIDNLSFRAILLHPWEENFQVDHERMVEVMGMIAEHQIPVIIIAGFPWVSEPLQILSLAKIYPSVPIIMSNGGQLNISGLGQADATLALQKADNLYIDTAGVYRQDFLEETVESFTSERVLFGSGSPLFDQEYEALRVRKLSGSQDQLSSVMQNNAERLLDI